MCYKDTKKCEKTVYSSHALNESTLHINRESAAKIKHNVESASSVSALNTADDPDTECNLKVAQNERAAISCYTKTYKEKRNSFSEMKPHLCFKLM
jgi:hypothetical protein